MKMVKTVEVESIGISEEFSKIDKVLLKGRKGILKNDAYAVFETGGHTKDVYSLFTGEYNAFNEFSKGLMNFTGERVRQNVKTSREYPVSTLKFSDGSEIDRVRSDCSLPFTLLSGAEFLVDEEFLLDKTELKEYFQNMAERNAKRTERDIGEAALNKEVENLFRRASELELERIMDSIKKCQLKPAKSLGYETKRMVPYISDEKYSKCKLTNLGLGVFIDVFNAKLFGIFESGSTTYHIPIPISFSIIKNISNSLPNAAVDYVKDLQEKAKIIEDCGSIFEHMLDKSKTSVANVYVEAKCNKFLKLDPLKGLEHNSIILDPERCFVKLQRGTSIEMLEAPYDVGVSLWSKTLDNLMISTQKGQPIPAS